MWFELLDGTKISANSMLKPMLGRNLQVCSVLYFKNGRDEIKSIDVYCPQ